MGWRIDVLSQFELSFENWTSLEGRTWELEQALRLIFWVIEELWFFCKSIAYPSHSRCSSCLLSNVNHPPEAQSGDDITCALSSAPGFGGAVSHIFRILLKETEVTLVLSRFSSSHLLPWLPSLWVPAVLLFSFQAGRKLCVLVSPLELRLPWWYCKGGLCAMALFSSLAGVWAVQHFVYERNPSGILLELDLLETGPWWKPSLHNTLPTTGSGEWHSPKAFDNQLFCRCLARRLQIWRTRLNSSLL